MAEWLPYKIALPLAPAYVLLLSSQLPLSRSWEILAGLLGYYLATAALGYFLNDICDIECDQRAGKPNRTSQLKAWQRAAVIVVLALLSMSALALLPPSPELYGLAATEILFFAVYSFPPLRLKETLAGPFVDAFYAHVIPFAIGITAAVTHQKISGKSLVLAGIVAIAWQFFQGLRHILGHEISDWEADRKAGITTAVLHIGMPIAIRLHRWILPSLELALFSLLMVLIVNTTWVPLVVFFGFCAAVVLRIRDEMRAGFDPSRYHYLWDRLLDDYCRSWLGPLLLTVLAAHQLEYGLVLVAHLALFGFPSMQSFPSPPSWHVDTSLSQETGRLCLNTKGWWSTAAIQPARIDILIDGWPVTSARLGLPVPEIADRYSRTFHSIQGFESTADLDSVPTGRRNIDVRVVAVREDGTCLDLQRKRVSLPERCADLRHMIPNVDRSAGIYRCDMREDLLLDEDGYPRKLAFVHLPRTAGTFVNAYLADVLVGRGYEWHNSWVPGTNRDYTPDELLTLLDQSHSHAFVHNHVGNWPRHVFDAYRAKGWFFFAFVRDPADQICSLYYYLRQRQPAVVAAVSLDEFFRATISEQLYGQHYFAPDYWPELDCIEEYGDEYFARFLARFLGHSFQPRPRVNVSNNSGYQKLLADGELSAETHAAYLASQPRHRYQSILRGIADTDDSGQRGNAGRGLEMPGVRSLELRTLCERVSEMLHRFAAAEQLDIPDERLDFPESKPTAKTPHPAGYESDSRPPSL